MRRRVWPALGLVIGGLTLVAQVWHGMSLDGLGVEVVVGSDQPLRPAAA